MQRRSFLLATAGLAALGRTAGSALPIRRAVEYNMLPKSLTIHDRMHLARDCGFEEVECPTTPDGAEAQEVGRAAGSAKLRIHSVMNMDHWQFPLSSADPAVVERSLAGARVSLQNAHLWGADTVLLVPGVLTANERYADVYRRSRETISKLIPEAQRLGVVLGIEEVWNKFLLTPVEFAKYVDDFKTATVRAYFDVGNVVLYGYPQDWIRTLGKRIVKLHIKDFSFRANPGTDDERTAAWVGLGKGDIDWTAVHQALQDIGYAGTATVELPPGDAAYLRDVNERFVEILRGKN